MRVSKVIKLKEKFESYDITTSTENFYINVGESCVLVHNSPALFCGTNPENGKFFVGTKSIFNAEPKINYSIQDIDLNHPSKGLNSKLKIALLYIKELNIKNILQGDVMYTQEDLEHKTLNGEEYLMFQPNTIAYAVPAKSKLADTIKKTKIGIVFHTTYVGETIQGSIAKFGASVRGLKKSKNVYFSNADFKDLSGNATFDEKETTEFTKILSSAGKQFHKLDKKFMNELMQNEKLVMMVKTFTNKSIRRGEKIVDTKVHSKNLINFISDKFQVEIDKLKTDKSKSKKLQTKIEYVSFLEANVTQVKHAFDMQNILVEAKEMVIRKLESSKGIFKLFIQTDTGYRVTEDEGFVAIDRIGNAVKLVDRLEFSHANFTSIKSWDK